MSAAEADLAMPRARRGSFARLLGSELRLVFGRRRNQVGLLVLLGLVAMIGVALKISQLRHPGSRGGDLRCRLAGDRVLLGGEARTVIEGTFRI